MNKKILACAFALCLSIATSNSAHAALTWFNNLTIDTTYYYWDGLSDIWGVSWVENIDTGCASANSLKKAAWWISGAPAGVNVFDIGSARLAPAMMALGSGLKVDLLMDPANCHVNLGAQLHGVRIRKQ